VSYVPGIISRAEAQSFDRVAADYDRLGELAWDKNSIGHWLPGVMPASGRRALDLGGRTRPAMIWDAPGNHGAASEGR
jgi:hypothetical protein